ncbi:Noc2p family-domain-containing protein [Lipomyces kononenkoae]|uniref:Noc2p family-domain-containing protein n=1 Tax=Lipomyces kononenkoae TaxID=34357 RepID=A0ACC3T3U6_LIPKO
MVQKSTKKFQKKHLKRTIDQRKHVQAYKKKIAKGGKRKPSAEEEYYGDEAQRAKRQRPSRSEQALGDGTNAKDFFAGGVQDNVEEALAGVNKKRRPVKAKDDDDDDGVADFTSFLDQDDQDLLNEENASEESDNDEVDGVADEEILEGSDDEDGDVPPGKNGKKTDDDREELTRKDIAQWKKSLTENKSLRALKQVAVAFRAAVYVGKAESEAMTFKYTITDPAVYNDIVMLALTQFPEVLNHHIPVITSSAGRRTVATTNKKYQQLTPLLKSLSASLLRILSDLNDPKTVSAVLTATEKLLPYFASFRRYVKQFIRAVVDIWSTAPDESTRLMAWVVIRSAAESGDKGMLELCMKTSYAGMIKNCRQTSIHTIPLINFMKNTAATLYALNREVSYQTAFDYIRQLAIHLRNSVVHKSKDSYKTVYNWQYIHSLDFWRRVLSLHCDTAKELKEGKESALRPLIYPLVQVILGTMRLVPAAQYFPLRFTLFRSLIDLSRHADVYIPLLPTMTELLTSTTVTRPGKPSTLRPFDFEHNIRANAAYLGTRIYQTGVCEQIIDCIIEFYGLYAKHISFPELVVPCVITLKRYARKKDRLSTATAEKGGKKGKKRENIKFHKQLLEVVEKLELNSKFVQDRRKNVEFSPANHEQVNQFLKDVPWEKTPLGQYLKIQREVKEERLRILRASMENDGEQQETQEDDVMDEVEDDDNDDEDDSE